MTNNSVSNRAHASEIAYDSFVHKDIWRPYKFNYNGAASPSLLELNLLRNHCVMTTLTDHIITYYFADAGEKAATRDAIKIDEPTIVLAMSTTNSAHSISELLSFLNFYLSSNLKEKIAVSSIIRDKLKFLFQLLYQFIPEDRILVLIEGQSYQFSQVWIRRNDHFCLLKTWKDIPFTRNENTLVFHDLYAERINFNEDPGIFLEKSNEIFHAFKDRYGSFDKVMLAKLSTDVNMTTPGRALEVRPNVLSILEKGGIKLLSLSDFADVTEYVASLYGAEKFITSYGGAACTNRFFLNPEAEVLLIGNKHYAWEYEYPSDQGDQWHLRHSHLFPVKKQTVLLYHNDQVTVQDAHRILEIVA